VCSMDDLFSYSVIPTVITEILSAQGNKNSASSTQDWSRSWHRINSSAQQKGQKTIQMIKNSKALYRTWARACARVTTSYKARMHARGAAVGRKTRAPAKRCIY
jgi:hypothetical protein